MPQVSHVAAHLVLAQSMADTILDLQAGQVFNLKIAIGFATADATALATLPTAVGGPKNAGTLRYRLISAMWETTTSWTGGASSSIGLSSSNALFNTKGDLLAATLAAALVSTAPFSTTSGTKFGNNGGVVVLSAGDAIRFDQVVSAFTVGAGFAHLNFQLVN